MPTTWNRLRYGCGAGRLLTAHLDAWRTGRGATVPEEAFNFGTVGWVFDRYLKSSAFERRVSMHKTPQALRLYVKRSEQQRAAAERKRRSFVAKSM